MKMLETALVNLGLIQSARTVYTSLLLEGDTSARLLAKRTGLTRPSVYDQLKDLRNRGLVVERDVEGKTLFSATEVSRLDGLLRDKIELLEASRNALEEDLPALLAQAQSVQPKIQFFEGTEGVQQLMKDMLWFDDIIVKAFWPYREMVEILGEDFLSWFNERRIKRQIHIHSIWPHADKKISNIFTGQDDFVTKRYALPTQKTKMSYLIYGDKTIFISSTNEAFGFLVQSAEYAKLMEVQFDSLWSTAKK